MSNRTDFEAWARDNVGQPSFAGKHIRDGAWNYNHNFIDAHWRAWQAATLAERERAAKVCEEHPEGQLHPRLAAAIRKG